jgi:para-aminobenzoate synthetase component II
MHRDVLIMDNYDSFTYNLADALGRLGAAVRVARSDAIDVRALARRPPAALVISPGPGRPESAGKTMEAILALRDRTAILGVCLGHQAIGAAFGAQVVRASEAVHGRATLIRHVDHPLFAGLPESFLAGRYHSLVLASPLPDSIRAIAFSAGGVVMAIAASRVVFGVQFHPESILTKSGPRLLRNFLTIAGVMA